jgi:spore maturation protein CgeB
VLRAPQDFVGQRFLLAAANKTVVISEPVNDSLPFVPGKHMVVTQFDDLADKVAYYLKHEQERQALAENAYQFVSEELTSTNMVGRILTKAREHQLSQEKVISGV